MQFILSINANGAAFTDVTSDENNGRSNAAPEVAKLLHKAARTLEGTTVPVVVGDVWPLIDTNGAMVGSFSFTEED